MKILIGVANHAYSFILQAEALSKGFSHNQVENSLLPLDSTTDIPSAINEYNPDLIITIGNWIDYDLLVKPFQGNNYKVIPWIVSDDYKIYKYVEEYNKLSIILTPSQHCKKNLVRSGIKEDIIRVIPAAVDNDFWRPIEDKDKIQVLEYLSVPIICQSKVNKFNLKETVKSGVPIIYTTGGDATKKGAREVLEALSLLDKDIPWVYLIKTWPGIKTFENSIEEIKLAEELGIINKLRYLVGEYSQEFMLGIMNICDIYAAPSRFEGFGLPLVEAQMCGKPVVTTYGTSTQETVVHGKTGFICQNETYGDNLTKANSKDLSIYLEKLITSPELRLETGKNAFNHAVDNFSPSVIAHKFLDLVDNF